MKEAILAAAALRARASGSGSAQTMAALVAAGACSAAQFREAFGDDAAFRAELAACLFVRARDHVITQTASIPQGLEQLVRAYLIYLDYNLAHPELQELAHVLEQEPGGPELLARMASGVAMVSQADLLAAGAEYPMDRASALTGEVIELVRAEFKARAALPARRERLVEECRASVRRD